jgi:hypothetical protein
MFTLVWVGVYLLRATRALILSQGSPSGASGLVPGLALSLGPLGLVPSIDRVRVRCLDVDCFPVKPVNAGPTPIPPLPQMASLVSALLPLSLPNGALLPRPKRETEGGSPQFSCPIKGAGAQIFRSSGDTLVSHAHIFALAFVHIRGQCACPHRRPQRSPPRPRHQGHAHSLDAQVHPRRLAHSLNAQARTLDATLKRMRTQAG